jgi:hypothetical protein
MVAFAVTQADRDCGEDNRAASESECEEDEREAAEAAE